MFINHEYIPSINTITLNLRSEPVIVGLPEEMMMINRRENPVLIKKPKRSEAAWVSSAITAALSVFISYSLITSFICQMPIHYARGNHLSVSHDGNYACRHRNNTNGFTRFSHGTIANIDVVAEKPLTSFTRPKVRCKQCSVIQSSTLEQRF